jgi:alpha-mannosidase
MKIFRFPLFVFLFLSAIQVVAQITVPVFGNQKFINGYEKSISGESIPYFSVYANYAKEALLTRCTDGKKTIEWETSVIPANTKGEYAYFTWISGHSSGTSSGERKFDVYINDNYALTFTTFPKQYNSSMTYGAADSTRIVLEYKVKDFANDAHGFSYLRVPLKKYPKGKSLKLKIVGQAQNSNDWYMTFKYSFKEKIDVEAFPFILKNGRQALRFTVLHFGAPTTLFVNINKNINEKFYVKNGFNIFETEVDAVEKNTTISIDASVGKLLKIKQQLTLKPVHYREIDLIHHAHTDIGYSHIQEDAIKIHKENIRQALRLIEKTKNYPAESKFKWNIESSWAVENFLSEASSSERKLFFDAVREGSIAISATYANILTGLCTPEEMNWISDYSRKLKSTEGIPIQTAMLSDIPGMSWSMVPALAQNGIRYFSNGPNYVGRFPDKGDRIGHTLTELGNKAFWWKSSSGRDSLLLWTCGKGYSSWHGVTQGAVNEKGPQKIAEYMNELDSIHYPYKFVQWRYNIVADNGPTDSTISDFVKNWNEKYISPKLILANVNDLFMRFEKEYGNKIPVLSGDFTPYWEDGAYSTAKEEGTARLLSEKITLLENFFDQKKINLPTKLLYLAKKNVLLFHEHTWGSWNSTSSPDEEFTKHQWNYKKNYLDSAKFYVDKLESELQTFLPVNKKFLTVYNTLNWERSGYAEINCPAGFTGNFILDETGNKIPIQRLSENKLCFIAKNIPAKGEKKFSIPATGKIEPESFETPSLQIDVATGAINSIGDEKWTDTTKFAGLFEALYVKGLDPSRYSKPVFKSKEWIENGPVKKTLRIKCDIEGTNGIIYELTYFNDLDHVKASVIIDKKSVRGKESMHIVFPFAIQQPQIRIGADEGIITPGCGQLPGANKDFFSVQRWIDVSNDTKGATICSPQGALFETGNMINEELNEFGTKTWKKNCDASSTLFLYALNNYWHTNYKADQEGIIQFDIYLRFHKTFDHNAAQRFGYEVTQPLVVAGH